jgi:4-amino-4-deoxy-L-arabinose transferase-like glycosyltransferase
VFAATDPVRLFAVAAVGVVLAGVLGRLTLHARRPAAVLLIGSCAVGVCSWGAPEVLVDASRYFTQAKHLEVYGLGHFLAEWGREIPAWTDLPLVPLLFGLVFRLLGESRIFIQAFTTLLFAASVLLTFKLGRELWDAEVGFAAGALLLSMPYLLTQVPGMMVDVPAMFFLTWALAAGVDALRRPGPGRILLAALAVSLAFFSKYSVWLLLSVLPVAWAVLRRGAPRALRTGLAVALISGSLVGAALLWNREVISAQIALLLEYQVPGLRRWGESYASTFLFQIHPFLTAAALLSVWRAVRRRDPKVALVCWPVLLLLALRVERIRYWIPVFPMLALMAAQGLQAVRPREVRSHVLFCTVVGSLLLAGTAYLPFLRGTSAANLKAAGEFLDALAGTQVEVYTPSPMTPEVNPAVSVPLLDLFTSKQLAYRYQPAPAPERVGRSPLRFTWTYRNPAYYQSAAAVDAAVVVISSDVADDPASWPEPLASRLAGHRLARRFAVTDGVFEHQTLVSVYRAEPPRGR